MLVLLLLVSAIQQYQILSQAVQIQHLQALTEQEQKLEQQYTGNPFSTEFWLTKIQSENITGMHWYTWLNNALQNRTDVLAYPSQPAKFIVENVSGTIIWKDGTNGTVYATGTTASEATNIINWALGNLTSGRTWKEMIVLKGNFQIAATIKIPSYTSIRIGGKLTLKPGVNAYMFQNAAGADGNITIKGGKIVGNLESSWKSAIYLVNVSSVRLEDIHVHNYRHSGIIWENVTNSEILFCNVENSTDDGLSLFGSSNNLILGGMFKNNGDDGISLYYSPLNAIVGVTAQNNSDNGIYVGSGGAPWDHGSPDVLIIGNTIRNNVGSGIKAGDPQLEGHRNIMDNNIIEGNQKCGMNLLYANSFIVKGNVIRNNKEHGIYFYGAPSISKYTIITENQIVNNGQAGDNTFDGIFLYRVQRFIISHNLVLSDVVTRHRYSIRLSSSDYNMIQNNVLLGSASTPIYGAGANTKIRWNSGFVTENSGTATVANGEYIAHGIDSSLNIGQSNSSVQITEYTKVYGGVPVTVGCDFVNGTHIRAAVYWVNGTAITDDAIQIWWRVEYAR